MTTIHAAFRVAGELARRIRSELILFSIACAASLTGCATQNSPNRPLFSEDFEAGRLDPKIWTTQITGSNIIQVQSDKSAHGKYALLVRCPVPSEKTWAFITMTNLPPALRQHHFGRAYVFITPQPPTRHTIFIMAGTPGFPHNKFQEIATAHGRWQLTYVDLRPEGDKEDYHSGPALPVNRWFCLEWEFNDHPNHTTIWVDNEKVFDTGFVSKTTGATSDLVGAFTDYAFGIRLWGKAPAPFDIYFDDIALDTNRISSIPSELSGSGR
jgi:hypothetical protein